MRQPMRARLCTESSECFPKLEMEVPKLWKIHLHWRLAAFSSALSILSQSTFWGRSSQFLMLNHLLHVR
jgi:hypothetical protein